MKCPVYRSLDKPSAFFGIRGRFTSWMLGIVVVLLFAALFLGALMKAIVGVIFFLAGVVAAYVYILNLQGKSSDRAFSMKLNSRRYPRFVRTPPGALRHMWNFDR